MNSKTVSMAAAVWQGLNLPSSFASAKCSGLHISSSLIATSQIVAKSQKLATSTKTFYLYSIQYIDKYVAK